MRQRKTSSDSTIQRPRCRATGFHGFDAMAPQAALSLQARAARVAWLHRIFGVESRLFPHPVRRPRLLGRGKRLTQVTGEDARTRGSPHGSRRRSDANHQGIDRTRGIGARQRRHDPGTIGHRARDRLRTNLPHRRLATRPATGHRCGDVTSGPPRRRTTFTPRRPHTVPGVRDPSGPCIERAERRAEHRLRFNSRRPACRRCRGTDPGRRNRDRSATGCPRPVVGIRSDRPAPLVAPRARGERRRTRSPADSRRGSRSWDVRRTGGPDANEAVQRIRDFVLARRGS